MNTITLSEALKRDPALYSQDGDKLTLTEVIGEVKEQANTVFCALPFSNACAHYAIIVTNSYRPYHGTDYSAALDGFKSFLKDECGYTWEELEEDETTLAALAMWDIVE